MTPFDFQPADRPTFYFVGVSTGQSSIMRVFPEWAKALGLGDCPIHGIDCRPHDAPEVYRRVVAFLKHDALSLGGLVTTHKIDLLNAARDLFDGLTPDAELLGEVSCIFKRGGRLLGDAKDPLTSGLALAAFLPPRHWAETGAEVCVLGAGGSSLALTTCLMKAAAGAGRPSRLIVTNRSTPRLASMKRVHAQIASPVPVTYVHAPAPARNDAVLAGLPCGSLVVNATGLGKDAPGSPITDAATFPANGLAWEFNYRGALVFLEQANAQRQARNLHVEDGWVYFLHGWTRVIADVFDVEIPTGGPEFEELARIAEPFRRQPGESGPARRGGRVRPPPAFSRVRHGKTGD